MTFSSTTSRDYFALIEEIEQRYPVARWVVRGVPVWPVVRINARYELQKAAGADTRRTRSRSRVLQAMRAAAAPLLDPVRNSQDWGHEAFRLTPADALFLSDGVSQDRIEGTWRDRYCAPLIEALGEEGRRGLLMHPGDTQRLPRQHMTYSAHWIDSWSRIAAQFPPQARLKLDGYEDVQRLVRKSGLNLTAFDAPFILRSAARIAVMARLFDHVLSRTRPEAFFAVSYYWDLGFAANLACRRRGVLSVDVQHGVQGGRHEAYNLWRAVPPGGYSILPAVFWNWSQDDAQAVNDWAGRLAPSWHVGICGGHPQLMSWLDDSAEQTRKFDAAIASCKERRPGELDILVALQDMEGYASVWDNLADLILASPRTWRWWLRRHPVPKYNRGVSIAKVLAVDQPNVIVEEASSFPLPALLRNVDTVIGLISSVAIEASFFGHRPVFLTEDARDVFPDLFAAGKADIITDFDVLNSRLSTLKRIPDRRCFPYRPPPLSETFRALWIRADEYRDLIGKSGYDG